MSVQQAWGQIENASITVKATLKRVWYFLSEDKNMCFFLPPPPPSLLLHTNMLNEKPSALGFATKKQDKESLLIQAEITLKGNCDFSTGVYYGLSANPFNKSHLRIYN